jgi:hypothetical protein
MMAYGSAPGICGPAASSLEWSNWLPGKERLRRQVETSGKKETNINIEYSIAYKEGGLRGSPPNRSVTTLTTSVTYAGRAVAPPTQAIWGRKRVAWVHPLLTEKAILARSCTLTTDLKIMPAWHTRPNDHRPDLLTDNLR